MNDLFAKQRHSTEIIKTVWQEQKGTSIRYTATFWIMRIL